MTGKVSNLVRLFGHTSRVIVPEPHLGINLSFTLNKDPAIKQKAYELCSTLLGEEWSDRQKLQGEWFN